MIERKVGISLAAAALVLAGETSLADVKAGVDAWSRGDYAAAVGEWQEPADKGDPDAQFNLAQAYKLGRGVKTDLHKAEELFGKAAAKGHLQASDMYGLLLFQRGERAKALPYIRAAADRGEPRAQYLLGVAHFNGDNVPKDWVRAYALTSLAQQAGIEQAKAALAQMDRYIPLNQRQQAAALAPDLASQSAATRQRQLAAADLGATVPPAATTRQVGTPPPRRGPAATAADAAAVARAAAENSPRYAGADYARPQGNPPGALSSAAGRPPASAGPIAAQIPESGAPIASTPPASQSPATSAAGAWRVQLGAFSVTANANALWARVKDRPELAGSQRQAVAAGGTTRLSASGFASREAAQSACSRLSKAGFSCLVARN